MAVPRRRRFTCRTLRPPGARVIPPKGESLVPPGDDAAAARGGYGPRMAEPGQISVLIADDQVLVRAGFRAILEAQPGIRVGGEAADGPAANDLVRLRQ